MILLTVFMSQLCIKNDKKIYPRMKICHSQPEGQSGTLSFAKNVPSEYFKGTLS